MKYFVRLDDKELEVGIDGENVTLNSETFRAHVESVTGTPIQLVAIGNEVHRVFVRRGEHRGQFELQIDGFRLKVEALDERARAVRELSGASRKVSGPAHLRAPMPGLIVRVNVNEGDQVRVGQGLVVMEAMKMENELRAAAAGIVRKVLVSAGSAVEKGALLLELE
jgi:biotin carboxyl carrier protein